MFRQLYGQIVWDTSLISHVLYRVGVGVGQLGLPTVAMDCDRIYVSGGPTAHHICTWQSSIVIHPKAEATFNQSNKNKKILQNYLNPVKLVFIE